MDNVCVVVRVRPLTPAECDAGQYAAWAQSRDSIWLTIPRPLSATGMDRPMGFDRVFGPDASNREMYEELMHDRVERVLQASAGGPTRAPPGRVRWPSGILGPYAELVFPLSLPWSAVSRVCSDSLLSLSPLCAQGYNATVMAYGQTCSGKTSTIRGGAEVGEGLIALATRHVLAAVREAEGKVGAEKTLEVKAEERGQEDSETASGSAPASISGGQAPPVDEWAVHLSYLEVYQEGVTDLITGKAGLALFESKGGEAALSPTFSAPRPPPSPRLPLLIWQVHKRASVWYARAQPTSSVTPLPSSHPPPAQPIYPSPPLPAPRRLHGRRPQLAPHPLLAQCRLASAGGGRPAHRHRHRAQRAVLESAYHLPPDSGAGVRRCMTAGTHPDMRQLIFPPSRIVQLTADGTRFQSELNLVDLAGSEKASAHAQPAGPRDTRSKEAGSINKSLLVLAQARGGWTSARVCFGGALVWGAALVEGCGDTGMGGGDSMPTVFSNQELPHAALMHGARIPHPPHARSHARSHLLRYPR